MPEISRTALFGKLDELSYRAIESATVFCKMRGNPYVELAHWIHQMLQQSDSDLHRAIRHFQLDAGRVARDLTDALDRLPRGATSISDLSVHVEEAVERGWVYATLAFDSSRIRTGHLLIGMLKTSPLRNALGAISREFLKIKADELSEQFAKITSGSPEERQAGALASAGAGGAGAPTGGEALGPAVLGKQEALARFSVDLTERARQGEIDPVLGRDEEIRQLVHVLMRRRQNNPILTGEAGVGKTAVVEGLALRIAKGDVPPAMKDVAIRSLDLGLLQAGASMKGEFENRLRQVIEEVQASPKPIILFIDEAHTLIGAGGSAGTGDAANLLKPALARGKLRTIAATTWAEYKKHIEGDPALTRRFQVVQVAEPSEDRAILMMRGVVSTLEKHHRVQLLDEAIEAAVKLSKRYIPDRQLPDKAVSLLDTTCARVAMSQHAVPPDVEATRRRIEALETELEIIAREQTIGLDVGSRRLDAEQSLADERRRLTELEARWKSEKALVDRILQIRAELRAVAAPVPAAASPSKTTSPATPAPPTTARPEAMAGAGAMTGAAAIAGFAAEEPREARSTNPDSSRLQPSGPEAAAKRENLLSELRGLTAELGQLQGEAPLILPTVDAGAVAAVVADWTGVPVGRMVRDEVETVLKLSEILNERVIGQKHALDMIARRIQTARAGLENPNKPIGVFMLAGPSGVGKTETALALAEALYGGEQNVITINMSEFQEAHTVSTLKGAPPGYVGYGEGGVLTEAVRRRPYSVVLLDEVEKAHPDVHELFFQVFDKGWMEDGQGTRVDFKNTIILLTSNAGTDEIVRACADPARLPSPAELAESLRTPLLRVFPAALLGRMVVIPYYPLTDEMLAKIIRIQLDRIVKRVEAKYAIPFTYDDSVVSLVTARCTELESGGRMIDAVLTNTMLPEVSRELLVRMLDGKTPSRVAVSADGGELRYHFD